MSLDKLEKALQQHLDGLNEKGTAKGKEMIITNVIAAQGDIGSRFNLKGQGDKQFVKMNANSYLGLSLDPEVIKAEEEAALKFGAGPGAVRWPFHWRRQKCFQLVRLLPGQR